MYGADQPWECGQQAVAAHHTKEITPWEPLPQAGDNQSTYSAHYQRWPATNRQSIRPKDERPMTAYRFETRSTMQDSYQNVWGNHMPKSCRPKSAYEPKDWMQPISTTAREAYQRWSVPKQQAIRPKSSADPIVNTATGRSTMQDSYQPVAFFVPSKSARPAEQRLDETTFDGTTTSRASYQAWPIPPKYVRVKQQAGGWEGQNQPMPNTTYRDMFREIRIMPAAQAAVGIQVVGGKFYPMLPRGTRPPASKKVLMTTTMNRQSNMDIVIVQTADRQEKTGTVLGEFTLDGIVPSGAGVAQVEVTFVYNTDHTLRVSANDLQGNRTRALSVKKKVVLG